LPFSSLWQPTPSYALRGWLMIALLAVLGGAAWFILRKRLRLPEKSSGELGLLRLAGVFALFSAIYLVFIVLSFFLSSPRNDMDARLLSPAYLGFIMAVFPLLAWLSSAERAKVGLSWVSPFLLSLLIAGGVTRSYDFVQRIHLKGAGYTSRAWQNSATLQAVKRLDPGVHVITNESAAVLFLADRPAYDVVQFFLSAGNEVVPAYGENLADPAQRLFQDGEAVLVIFTDYFYWQLYPIYGDRTQQVIDAFFQTMHIEKRLPDGIIFRNAKP
jgi:hypothetical protein